MEWITSLVWLTTQIHVRLQVYVAAFSISGYAWASWRSRYKPFNPVLGETFEIHREDRGFHFVSEQVTGSPSECVENVKKYVAKVQSFSTSTAEETSS